MIINHNSSSIAIKAWQSFLDQQGCQAGKPDGVWGKNTTQGTKQFQSNNALTSDGIPGSGTLKVAKSKGFVLPKPTEIKRAGNCNVVFDVSHHNGNMDFNKAKASGMAAVFHKATQSVGRTLYRDKTYQQHRKEAKAAGLLWGAYHFGTGGSGVEQANSFIDFVQPNGDTLLVLDFEECTTSGETTMTLAEAEVFVERVKTRTGKYPGLYGGSLLRHYMQRNPDTVLTKCWLWVAAYGSHPHLPQGWSGYTLWQYTDGVHGPGAVPVAGIGLCDRSLYRGTVEELEAFWEEQRV